MTSLPPALDFAAAEEEICERWTQEETFKMQDKLSLERGDAVSSSSLLFFFLGGGVVCLKTQYNTWWGNKEMFFQIIFLS